MNTLWRLLKFVLGISFLAMGGINLLYIMNDSVAGYAAGHPYRNQEFIGTGVLVGLGLLLIVNAFMKKNIPEDKITRTEE